MLGRVEEGAYVSNAVDSLSLKLAIVKFLNGSLQVSCSLKFNKAIDGHVSLVKLLVVAWLYEPSAVSITACFRVYNIETRLSGEVFKVLYPESM